MKRLHSDGHDITGVAPPPQDKYKDKMVGWAQLHEIPVISDCDRLLSSDIPNGTDLIVAAHSHWIISERVLGECRYGGIGFHPSLLPRHRGADAVRWTIKMGDAVTGGSIYRLTDKCDGGGILLRDILFVERSWDYHDLWRALFPLGVDLVSRACRIIEETGNTQREESQDESVATWEPSWERPRLKRNELLQLPG